MPARPFRSRAIPITLAAGVAVTVALTAVVAVPAVAVPSSLSTASVASMPTATSTRHIGPASGAGAVAPRTVASHGVSRLASPASASTTPVGSSAAGSVAPAPVNAIYNADEAIPTSDNLNGFTYGVGYDAAKKLNLLESWSGYSWQQVAGEPQLDTFVSTVWQDAVYFVTFDGTQTKWGTSTLWKYQGTTFSKVSTAPGFENIQAAGDNLIEIVTTDTTTITQIGATPAPATSTSLSISGSFQLGGSAYVWTDGQGNNSSIYRVDPTGLTFVVASPYAIDSTSWNGAIYFGGATDSGVGVYEFDGSHVTPVDVGDVFANAQYVPSVGNVGGNLYFTADSTTAGGIDSLYVFDGGSSTLLGALGSKDSYAFNFTSVNNDLLFGVATGDEQQTYIYAAGVQPGTWITVGIPSIIGSPDTGSTLTAEPGNYWTPTVTFTYQWFRDGVLIPGATGRSYQIPGRDYSHELSFSVTGSQVGYSPMTQTYVDTTGIGNGTVILNPVITGNPTAGQTLTASLPGLVPTDATLVYKWHRDGKIISGATSRTYRATAADVAHSLNVTVTGSESGFSSSVKTSASRLIGNAFLKTPTPAVIGTFAVGHTVAAVHGTWSPTPTFHYQWFRGTSAIKGAVKSTYTLTSADRGTSITVQVIGTRANYTAVYKMSGGHMVK